MTPAPELREALARALAINDGWSDPDALWTENLSVIAAGGQGDPVYREYLEDADRALNGPLAFLSDLTRQAAEAQRERDTQSDTDALELIACEEQCRRWDERAGVLVSERDTALAKTARLQAEIEGLRAALKLRPMSEWGWDAQPVMLLTHDDEAIVWRWESDRDGEVYDQQKVRDVADMTRRAIGWLPLNALTSIARAALNPEAADGQ